VVMDEKGITRSMRSSLSLFFKKFDYFVIWMFIAVVLLSVLDFVFVHITGPVVSQYIILIISSVFILPFLMLLQGQFYISKYKLLG